MFEAPTPYSSDFVLSELADHVRARRAQSFCKDSRDQVDAAPYGAAGRDALVAGLRDISPVAERLTAGRAADNTRDEDACDGDVPGEAFAAGEAAARTEFEDEKAQLTDRIVALTGSISDWQAEDLRAMSAALNDLVLALVKTVVGDEIKSNPASIGARVDAALGIFGEGLGEILLCVSADDADLLAAAPPRAGVKIVSDPAVARGDFHLRRDESEICDSIGARLAALAEQLEA